MEPNILPEPVVPNPSFVPPKEINTNEVATGKPKFNPRLAGWLAIIVGVFFGLIALFLLANDFTLLFSGGKAEGIVQSVSCQWDAAGVTRQSCTAQISYTTKDGQAYPGTVQDADPLTYTTGQKISVLYNLNNPNEMIVEDYLLFFRIIELIFIPAIALIGGIFLLKKFKPLQAK